MWTPWRQNPTSYAAQDCGVREIVAPVFTGAGSTLEDSVPVVSDSGRNFQLLEIPAGTYELTVKVDGYVSGRSDTLQLFDGLNQTGVDPTFGSDLLGNLSPATALGELRGGDATGDNQIDVNADGVVNSLDLGFVSTNFGNDGFGAPPVFKGNKGAGDSSTTVVKVEGIDEVETWWVGKVFEVTARASSMTDVSAFGLALSYDPERVKPLGNGQAVTEGDVFKLNPQGSLFYQRTLPGRVENMSWDGTTSAGHKVSSGVYFYSLEVGEFSQIRKMTLLKWICS